MIIQDLPESLRCILVREVYSGQANKIYRAAQRTAVYEFVQAIEREIEAKFPDEYRAEFMALIRKINETAINS